jgi:putative transposase
VTAPRQVLPGATYLLTRRCAQRQFLLRPGAVTNRVFGYVLAVAARRFRVQVHACCVLSNHFHLVVTDPEARLPAFQQYLGSLVARALNASLGRWESFWGPSSYSAVRLETPEDVLDKAAYVLANPVAAGLVRRGRDWPGLWSAPGGTGPVAFKRPAEFFRAEGPMPEVAELETVAPAGFASAEQFRRDLEEAVSGREEQAARDQASAGKGFAGSGRVLAQAPSRRPPAREARGQLRPRVAARDRWRRAEALARLVEFLHSYRQAWAAFRAGLRQVVFPAGTYLLRVTHGVRCAAPA